jgi:tellurium resistance protein TerD
MARFDLKKDERFDLQKDETGLNKIKVLLGWKKGADLDASAFLLGADGTIINDADFVFYKSANREKPFSREEFGSKPAWRTKTRPMSADGSVLGSYDDRGNAENDASGDEDTEEMFVDLSKVDPKINEIVFCVTIYNEEPDEKSFKDVRDPYITLINQDNGEEICRYNLQEDFSNETAVAIGSLLINDEGDWTFQAEGKGYAGGLETLIDIYAS